MKIYTPTLAPFYRYMRTMIVFALGGFPKENQSNEELDFYIVTVNPFIVELLHDLVAMLEYLHELIKAKIPLQNEEHEIFDVAEKLIFEVKQIKFS